MNRTSWTVLVVVVIVIIVVSYLFQKYSGNSITSLTPTPTPVASSQNSFDIQGMKVEILQQGNGDATKNNDVVTVNYVGTLTNGTKFDSSFDRNQPFSFTLGSGQVIKGWDLGVLGMKVGETRRLTIPAGLAYGSQAVGAIPANSTLIFEVSLLGINTALGK